MSLLWHKIVNKHGTKNKQVLVRTAFAVVITPLPAVAIVERVATIGLVGEGGRRGSGVEANPAISTVLAPGD